MKSEQLELIAFFTLALIAAAAWYFLWVKPHDAYLYAIMDCMGPDSSRSAYDVCVTLLKR